MVLLSVKTLLKLIIIVVILIAIPLPVLGSDTRYLDEDTSIPAPKTPALKQIKLIPYIIELSPLSNRDKPIAQAPADPGLFMAILSASVYFAILFVFLSIAERTISRAKSQTELL